MQKEENFRQEQKSPASNMSLGGQSNMSAPPTGKNNFGQQMARKREMLDEKNNKK